MTRAVISDQFGPPEAYALRDIALDPPGDGQVLVAVKAAGISFVDVLTAAGEYQVKPPLPFIPGSEFAGVVVELGPGASGLTVGDRVMGSSWGGVFAEALNARAANLCTIPEGLSFAEAAVLPVSYQTAHYALAYRAKLQAGETLLVLGAGGATGYAAVQLGKHFGAKVIASASSPAKRELALAGGAALAIDARAEDWREQIKAATAGKGVDVVFDPVGGAASEPAFRSLGWNGRHLIVGFPGGIATLRTNLPLLKGGSLIGVDIRQFGINEPENATANVAAVFALAEAGAIRPAIARTYPLADFVEAMNAARAGAEAGRIVLEMS